VWGVGVGGAGGAPPPPPPHPQPPIPNPQSPFSLIIEVFKLILLLEILNNNKINYFF